MDFEMNQVVIELFFRKKMKLIKMIQFKSNNKIKPFFKFFCSITI